MILGELACPLLRMPLLDLLLEFGIPHVEVILIRVDVQQGGHRNAVLFQYELFLIVMNAPNERTQVDASLGDRQAMYHCLCRHDQARSIRYVMDIDQCI